MMTGEYFLSEKAKDNIEKEKKRAVKEQKKQEKIEQKLKVLEAPAEEVKEDKVPTVKSSKPDLEELKKKFLKKK